MRTCRTDSADGIQFGQNSNDNSETMKPRREKRLGRDEPHVPIPGFLASKFALLVLPLAGASRETIE